MRATLWVDGKKLGPTPGPYKVALCSKSLEVRGSDKRLTPWKTALKLGHKRVSKFRVELKDEAWLKQEKVRLAAAERLDSDWTNMFWSGFSLYPISSVGVLFPAPTFTSLSLAEGDFHRVRWGSLVNVGVQWAPYHRLRLNFEFGFLSLVGIGLPSGKSLSGHDAIIGGGGEVRLFETGFWAGSSIGCYTRFSVRIEGDHDTGSQSETLLVWNQRIAHWLTLAPELRFMTITVPSDENDGVKGLQVGPMFAGLGLELHFKVPKGKNRHAGFIVRLWYGRLVRTQATGLADGYTVGLKGGITFP